MSRRPSVGFPRMNKEPAEKRVFLSEFIQFLTRYADVYLEEGYGSRSGFTFDDYRQGNPRVYKTERAGAFHKDFVLVLRSPNENEFQMIPRGSCLVSMLHYPTRPKRVQTLNELGINAISMDSIMNDSNIRLVENMLAVAWNGLEAAFDMHEQNCPGLLRENRSFNVLILGTGMVGKYAVDAATKLGNIERNNRHISMKGPGSVAICVGRNISDSVQQMERFLRQADVLVDATNRRNPSIPVVPNEWLGWLPPQAVIADLAVDPYLLDHEPVVVRGIEGIPQGNLDKFKFSANDPDWEKSVPAAVISHNRPAVVSCYSWPGIHPAACMEHYARQLEPLMEVLLTRPYASLTLEGSYFERALARAKLPL
jgi:alanine dehydrogenase